MNSKIRFNYADRKLPLSRKQHIKEIVELIFKNKKQHLGFLDYIFCSDDYLLEINQSFLKHDYYTDIITFDLSEPNSGTKGEIYVSIDRVKDNSQTQNVSFEMEALRVIFHGALHLCGYKDKTKEERVEMRKLEDKYIKIWKRSFT